MLQVSDAHALALGRMIVQSPLGEPLRAEVEVLEITDEQSESLAVGLAPLAAFQASGMEFNAALVDLRVSLERRANGSAFLRLTGNRPVSEPFMDMVLEASWKSGRVARDYTLLFDPPKLRQATPAPLAAASEPQSAPGSETPATAAQPAVVPSATQTPSTQAATPSAPTAPARNDRLRVERGDTAGRIALENLPANISLDQMLVAMLRNNPRAFIQGNVNRVKAGAVLTLPDENAASAVSTGEARQIISAQSRDFNEFRRRLAGQVPQAPATTAEREATGQIQAEVKEETPAAVTQDKLTVSKGAAPGKATAEDKIATERAAQEAADRTAELTRNIEELAKVGKETVAAGGAAAQTAAPVEEAMATVAAVTAETPPAADVQTPEEPGNAETEPTAAVDEVAAAEPVEEPAPAPAPAPEPAPVVAAPQEEASFLGKLLENPLVMPVAGGLLALLAGLGIYGLSRRKKAPGVDSSFLESRLQPDSFFGSSGGQRIDTSEAAASGSSMVYSPSQLDAAGDVDPVAEADVYLAYGRDLQAEEILKEAMRSTPTRVAIHNKLLEIYAKRRDAKAFEVVATEAFGLTQGEGSEWEHACTLGKELDPSNPLYQPGGRPVEKPGAPAAGAAAFGASTLAQNTTPGGNPTQPPDLDFDLDLDLDQPSQPADLSIGGSPLSGLDDLEKTDALTSAPAAESLAGATAANSEPLAFDLDFPSEPMPLSGPGELTAEATPSAFDEAEVIPDFNLRAKGDTPAAATETIEKIDSDLMSFDLNDIKLDLSGEELPTTESGALSEENPLETKLSLAEEFRAIGDMEGARSLAEEVMAEATGALKTKVASFLADLA
jgi:pilus assembly protein FimV